MQLLSEEIVEHEAGAAERKETWCWPRLVAFADELTRVMEYIPHTSPVLLSGDWGSGKSTILKRIIKQLNMTETGGQFNRQQHAVIHFEAWRYEREDSLLPSLIRCIWRDYKGPVGDKRKLFEKALAGALAITIRGLEPLTGNSGFFKGLTADKVKKEYDGAKQLMPFVFGPQRSLCDELSESFFNLLYQLHTYKTITILIDDLDRCSPESTLMLLDNIRMLINWLIDNKQDNDKQQKVRFLVAMDQVTITEIVGNKFADLDSYEANRYLEKLFPFTFKVPTLQEEELHTFVEKHIKIIALARLSDKQEQITAKLLEPAFLNPRLIKRCLNKYALYFHFNCHHNHTVQSIEFCDFPSICIWVPATERWPKLRRLLIRKPLSFWLQLQARIESTTERPETFEEVLKSDASKGFDDKEANELMAQKGFKEFFKEHMANDIDKAIAQFQAAEEELAKYGL